MKIRAHILSDSSLWLLLMSNVLTIYFAVSEGWAISTVLLIYWFQSASNGFFYVFRMHSMKKPLSNDPSTTPAKGAMTPNQTLKFLQRFFVFHYGIFMMMYFFFIFIFFQPSIEQALPFGGMFFFNHAFSYIYNKQEIKGYSQAIWGFFMPYIRNIPMHIIVAGAALFSSGGVWAVIIFLSLKTLVDILLHIGEHLFYRRNRPLSTTIQI